MAILLFSTDGESFCSTIARHKGPRNSVHNSGIEPHIAVMGVLIDVINPVGVECARPPDEAVHLIAFGEQQLC